MAQHTDVENLLQIAQCAPEYDALILQTAIVVLGRCRADKKLTLNEYDRVQVAIDALSIVLGIGWAKQADKT